MKKLVCLLLTLMIALTGGTLAAAAESNAGEILVAPEELPAGHWALYEAELASALENARARAPGQVQYALEARGDFNGYTGSKADGSLRLEYTVSDSMVPVGERSIIYLNLTCEYPPMVYTIGGLALDKDFKKVGDLLYNQGESFKYDGTTKTLAIPCKLDFEGYFNFVVVVSDGLGNQFAMTTPTVQVYDGEKPPFNSVGTDRNVLMDVDNSLGMSLSVDKTKTKVGHPITATATLTTRHDPVQYKGTWTLMDAQGNVLDTVETAGEANAQTDKATVTFSYLPLNAGEVQFEITATDGVENRVNINTPWLTVDDGLYIEAELNRAVMNIARTTRGSYTVHGHTCPTIYYFIGWEVYDGAGEVLESRTAVMTEPTGQDLYTPRIGSELLFYAGAGCEHFAATYQQDTLLLVGGIQAEIWPLTVTAQSGGEVGAGYSVSGGLAPYQEIVITGTSYDSLTGVSYGFMERTVTETEGTVFGTAHLGDQVYFEIRVVEEDGYSSVWKSEMIPMSEAPAVTKPTLTAAVTPVQLSAGENVTLTWQMVGGSGTINKLEPESSYVQWKNAEGEVLSEELIATVSGTAEFTPAEDGDYFCALVLTDGYNQQIKWTSEKIRVRTGRTPGDADMDGSVTIMDALAILQYDVGWDVEIAAANADVDEDGAVTIMDALAILQYDVGWDVELH